MEKFERQRLGINTALWSEIWTIKPVGLSNGDGQTFRVGILLKGDGALHKRKDCKSAFRQKYNMMVEVWSNKAVGLSMRDGQAFHDGKWGPS